MARLRAMDSPLTPATQLGGRATWTPFAAPDHLLGVLLDGRYLVDRRIAEGGMSVVYAGRDRQLRGLVAIKVLCRLGPEVKRRFAAEVEVLMNLQHPGVVRVLGYGHTPDDEPYMVLEYLAGLSLGDRLKQQGPLPWREAVAIGVQVGSALAALHAMGIVHRDIKPYNIMGTTDVAAAPIVKLIDLGLARIGDEFHELQDQRFTPTQPRRRTDIGRAIGTPYYLPPEAEREAATPGFDIYALAVTLYQLCTGRLPQETDLAPLHEVHPTSGVPEDLSRLLLTALAPDPADRLPSADHLQRGLEAILAAHPADDGRKHLFAGCYDRLELLGVGASSAAFRAHDRELDSELALKVLRKDKPDPDDELRFVRAAKILRRLRHPNIPLAYHLGRVDGQLFLALDLCPGVSATEFARPRSHLRPREVIAVGLQLASALAAVHAAGIVYRDLHAGNVLLDLQREPTAWLFDFDHAQLSPEFWARLPQRWATPPERRQEPKSEKPLQRMDYSAPEVRAGGPFTPASDVFALGLLLYRLLTGERPFEPGGTEARPPQERCPACPEALDQILLQMLSETPADRPRLEEIHEYLEAARDQLDAEESPAATGPVSAPPARETATESSAVSTPVAPEAQSIPSVAEPARTPMRAAWAGYLALMLGAAFCATWLFSQPPPPQAAPAPTGEAPPQGAASIQAEPPRTDEPPPLPDFQDALRTAEPELRRCAGRGGSAIFVELDVGAGAEYVTNVQVYGQPSAVTCAKDILAALRFRPAAAQTLREEYSP